MPKVFFLLEDLQDCEHLLLCNSSSSTHIASLSELLELYKFTLMYTTANGIHIYLKLFQRKSRKVPTTSLFMFTSNAKSDCLKNTLKNQLTVWTNPLRKRVNEESDASAGRWQGRVKEERRTRGICPPCLILKDTVHSTTMNLQPQHWSKTANPQLLRTTLLFRVYFERRQEPRFKFGPITDHRWVIYISSAEKGQGHEQRNKCRWVDWKGSEPNLNSISRKRVAVLSSTITHNILIS